jgi:hypothetical protein
MTIVEWVHFSDDGDRGIIIKNSYDSAICSERYRCGNEACGFFVLIKIDEVK